MNVTTWSNRFACYALLSILAGMLCLWSIDGAWAQDKSGDADGANARAEDHLDLRGDVPDPRRIDLADLHKLPRTEIRTTDPHDPSKEIIYSGTPLVELLKAGGLQLDSDTAHFREMVAITVLIEAADGYRAAFASAELDPELTDRIILLADTKDGQPLPPGEGPFRVIVPGEKRPARWVRQVKVVTVRKS
jgi:DMSO/TMAO reductase YedYZ molybdopterin-dependent catalytic subunit